ncbi:Clp1/GlmU family protein [Oceanithermus desulfurans]
MNLVLVGPTDRGNSTLARALAERAARRFGRAHLLDLDVGQGSLPGTVTLFRWDRAGVRVWRRLLVGKVQPLGAEAWLLAASARLARAGGAVWVADTDGWVEGAAARRFRYQQVEVLGAAQVGVLDDADLREVFAWRRDLEVRALPAPPGVRAKTAAERRRLRKLRLLRHLQGAQPRELELPPARPGYLYALLDGEGWFLGYGARTQDGRLLTPVRREPARVVPTWVRVPLAGLW